MNSTRFATKPIPDTVPTFYRKVIEEKQRQVQEASCKIYQQIVCLRYAIEAGNQERVNEIKAKLLDLRQQRDAYQARIDLHMSKQ
jgi:hypothetical protein